MYARDGERGTAIQRGERWLYQLTGGREKDRAILPALRDSLRTIEADDQSTSRP